MLKTDKEKVKNNEVNALCVCCRLHGVLEKLRSVAVGMFHVGDVVYTHIM